VKTGPNLADSSREVYGSKSAVLPMMMMMMQYNFNGVECDYDWACGGSR
jgi:hypothetical protein